MEALPSDDSQTRHLPPLNFQNDRQGLVITLQIMCGPQISEEELCYAASETQLKGKASKQSCIRGRNRRGLFGVINQRVGGGYTAAKYGAVSGPQPG
jgi:hypothetical protein